MLPGRVRARKDVPLSDERLSQRLLDRRLTPLIAGTLLPSTPPAIHQSVVAGTAASGRERKWQVRIPSVREIAFRVSLNAGAGPSDVVPTPRADRQVRPATHCRVARECGTTKSVRQGLWRSRGRKQSPVLRVRGQ